MDASTSHPFDNPIAWDQSKLAEHDTVYRQAPLHSEPHAEPLEGASITEPLAYGEAPTVLPINKRLMKSDHQQARTFEHWIDGKPPTTISDTTTTATHMCDVEGCDKAFVRKADLSRHLKSHKSGPRTYECPADKCPRKQMKGFWRMDKLKDHMERKHPEIEIERWTYWWSNKGGYRDVEKRAQHETLMKSKGWKPLRPGSTGFWPMSAAEMADV